MANIRYRHIFDNDLLRALLITQKRTMLETKTLLHVPYNSLLNQVKHIFTKAELDEIFGRNERQRWSKAEKEKIVRESIEHGNLATSAKYGISEGQLRKWRCILLSEEKRRIKPELETSEKTVVKQMKRRANLKRI